MTDITENLHGVLQNIVRNRNTIAGNLKQVDQAVSQLDEVSLGSIKQLLAKWEHPQAVGQFINAVAQKDSINRALGEMDTAIAVLQTAADDEAFQLQAQAQLAANEAAAASPPLPAAGQSGAPAPADQGTAAGSPPASDVPAVPAQAN